MNNRTLTIAFAVLAIASFALNFLLDHNAGTIFVLLTVAFGLASLVFFAKSSKK